MEREGIPEELKLRWLKRIKAYPWKSNFKDELLFY
jgi:hypothetical protein